MFAEVIKYGNKPSIEKTSTITMLERKPRRLCLANKVQASCFSRIDSDGLLGKFYSKFPNTINPIFSRETGFRLFQKDGAYGTTYTYLIHSDDEFQKVQAFVEKYFHRVFINDQLFVSMALGMHQDYKDDEDEPSHTEIGELERQAKYHGDKEAMQRLVLETIEFVKTTPYYNIATCICAMPSSKGLTKAVAKEVALSCDNLVDLSDCLSFENPKEEVKGLDGNQRWDALEKANLLVKNDVKDQVVILFDDMYQSGMSMQYAAMKILEVGAKNVYGLALVKSLTNNQ